MLGYPFREVYYGFSLRRFIDLSVSGIRGNHTGSSQGVKKRSPSVLLE